MTSTTTAPQIIHKSVVGLLAIYLVACVLFTALGFAAAYTGIRTGLGLLYAMGAAIVVVGALIQSHVYQSSYVQLNTNMMQVVSISTIVVSNTAETQWTQIQDVDVKKAGLFANLFDYGTLLVQTAGTERNLQLTMIPNVEHWRDVLMAKAGIAQ